MAFLHCLPILLFFITAFSFSTTHSAQISQESVIKAGYWPSYTASYVPISSINATLFTHIFYAFAIINPQTLHVEPDDSLLISQFSPTLHALNPSIITLLSIGGATSNTTLFSIAMATSASRKSFIDSSIYLARANGFQGLNIDWEFPRSEADMTNFGEFLIEWRDAVDREVEANNFTSTPLLLTAAIYYSSRVPSNNIQHDMVPYPIASLNENLDLVNIMSFDYHGSWQNFTGEPTALLGINTNFTTDFGLNQWIADELNPHKAIVGLATYGRSWTLLNASENGIGALAITAGPTQNTSNTPGVFFYFEIEDFVTSNNATIVYDNLSSSVYCYFNNVWIGYDDAKTFTMKINTFKTLGFKGYFLWALSYDIPKTWPLSTQASLAMENVTNSTTDSKASHYFSSSFTLILYNLFLACALIFLP